MIGRHVILEHWGGLMERDALETAMRTAAGDAGATVLSAHFHDFEGGGLTGVLLLAESHITVHTWPEHGYAALDIFMCGRADVRAAADALDAALRPRDSRRTVLTRGQRNHASQPA